MVSRLARLSGPLSAQTSQRLQAIEWLATDVDGTLTTHGKLSAEVVETIAALVAANIQVIPVSGRPTGEVLGLCRYLPGVVRAIAENGLVDVVPDRPAQLLARGPDRAALKGVGEWLNREHQAALTLTADDPFRLADVAYEREGRSPEALFRLRDAAQGMGVYMVWSSVHIHLVGVPPDKGAALLHVAAAAGVNPLRIVTVGDAPNDAGLFVEDRFGVTVGTADVPAQADAFPSLPQYVTDGRESAGFLELARLLLSSRA